ncbi:MFS transporter [Paenibacillus ihbetae]|uniref:MFS transporter n=1 Tax=Paenibacillus ihbetae TaxID=1870820 RepID=A0ABX3JQC5_9BACL|nr:MFS transporter [Paenibacillus ihbetae]OOC59042.1 MFS transporter [Paenibacillus ihbetae]
MKSKSFHYLWISQALANCGDLFYVVGLMAIVHEITGSAMHMAMIPFVTTLARFISGGFAPVLMDKYALKSLLLISQWGKTAVLLLLVMTRYALGNQEMTVYVILVMVLLISFLDGWAAPASHALLPRLVPRDELTRANSFVAVVDQMIQLGGWAAGGMLVAIFGGGQVIWLTVVLAAAAAVLTKRMEDPWVLENSSERKARTPYWSSMREGWVLIWKQPALRTIHVIYVLESIAGVVWIAAIVYVYVSEVLHKEEAWWGYINASFFLGLMAGGWCGMKGSRWMDRHIVGLTVYASFGISLMTFGFGMTSIPWLALMFSSGFGLFDQLKAISLQTMLQRSASLQMMPKVYAAQSSLISLVFGASTLLFGYVTDRFGVRTTFMAAAGILFLSGCYAFGARARWAPGGNGHDVREASSM